MKRAFLLLTMVLGFSMQAEANLELLGQGTSTYGTYSLIYDTDLNVTWYDYTSSPDLWQDQLDWADALSVTVGSTTYIDWRLPTTPQTDPGCSTIQVTGFNCTGSEMGDLYYTELGNTAGSGGFTNTDDFQNLSGAWYWSSSTYSTSAFVFGFDNSAHSGMTATASKTQDHYAIAVMDGRAVVPEPISSTLFIIGGATLGFRRMRKKRVG